MRIRIHDATTAYQETNNDKSGRCAGIHEGDLVESSVQALSSCCNCTLNRKMGSHTDNRGLVQRNAQIFSLKKHYGG